MLARSLSTAIACSLFAWGLVACVGVTPGQACTTETSCGDGFVCADDMRGGHACMRPCDAVTRLCSDGSVCLETPTNGRACWFGGRTGYGRACATTFECEPGTVCVDGEGGTLCQQACTVGDDRPCRAGEQTCASIAGSATEGYCQVIAVVDGGDGGDVDGGSDGSITTP